MPLGCSFELVLPSIGPVPSHVIAPRLAGVEALLQ